MLSMVFLLYGRCAILHYWWVIVLLWLCRTWNTSAWLYTLGGHCSLVSVQLLEPASLEKCPLAQNKCMNPLSFCQQRGVLRGKHKSAGWFSHIGLSWKVERPICCLWMYVYADRVLRSFLLSSSLKGLWSCSAAPPGACFPAQRILFSKSIKSQRGLQHP